MSISGPRILVAAGASRHAAKAAQDDRVGLTPMSDLLRDEVERAATRGQTVVLLAETVESSRCVETVRDLTKRFKPYERIPEAQAFQQRAGMLVNAA